MGTALLATLLPGPSLDSHIMGNLINMGRFLPDVPAVLEHLEATLIQVKKKQHIRL